MLIFSPYNMKCNWYLLNHVKTTIPYFVYVSSKCVIAILQVPKTFLKLSSMSTCNRCMNVCSHLYKFGIICKRANLSNTLKQYKNSLSCGLKFVDLYILVNILVMLGDFLYSWV